MTWHGMVRCKGTIDHTELKKVLDEMGEHFSIESVDELIAEIDTNQDGVVDFEEFKVMVEQSWFINTFQNRMARNIRNDHLRVMSQIEALSEVDEVADGDSTDDEEKENDFLLLSIDQLRKENEDLKEKITMRAIGDIENAQDRKERVPDATTIDSKNAGKVETSGFMKWSCLQVILDRFKYVDYKDRPHLYHQFG